MFIPFSSLPVHAKVWIYQSNKKLNEDQKEILTHTLKSFTEEWQVHGAPLEASFEIRFNHFVVLAANDTVSGCSIDTSVRIMKTIGEKIGVDFFDRTLIAFQNQDNVKLIPLKEIKTQFQLGAIGAETLMFNNAVNTLADLKQGWLVPASSTWLRRYFSEKSIAE